MPVGRAASSKAAIAALVWAAGAAGGVLIASGGCGSSGVPPGERPNPAGGAQGAVACTTTVDPGQGAAAIAGTIVDAGDGATICLLTACN